VIWPSWILPGRQFLLGLDCDIRVEEFEIQGAALVPAAGYKKIRSLDRYHNAVMDYDVARSSNSLVIAVAALSTDMPPP
jgi:hypothetical protein